MRNFALVLTKFGKNLLSVYDCRYFKEISNVFVITDDVQREIINGWYPEMCLSWLYDSDNSIESEIERVKGYSRAMLSISNDYATKECIDTMNAAGIYYQVYKVESQERMLNFIETGVPMIETNSIVPEN